MAKLVEVDGAEVIDKMALLKAVVEGMVPLEVVEVDLTKLDEIVRSIR